MEAAEDLVDEHETSAFQDYRSNELEDLYSNALGHPISQPISSLEDHVVALSRFTGRSKSGMKFTGFDVEFNYIEVNSEIALDELTACLDESNCRKNRYPTVVCPDQSRVVLDVATGSSSSSFHSSTTSSASTSHGDYINANFVDGFAPGTEKRYVVTQGPLPHTIADFWRMVVQYQISAIVMLTLDVEGGRRKSEIYWPDDDRLSLTFGSISVTQYELEMDDHIFIRRFVVANKDSSWIVTHFQYVSWPDHGLPVSTPSFLDLIELADAANHTNSHLLVHCSAGIGRSGTFCVVHARMEWFRYQLRQQRGKKADSLNLSFNLVESILRLRENRPGLVQTKNQLQFSYEALIQGLRRCKMQNTAAISNLSASLPHLMSPNLHFQGTVASASLPASSSSSLSGMSSSTSSHVHAASVAAHAMSSAAKARRQSAPVEVAQKMASQLAEMTDSAILDDAENSENPDPSSASQKKKKVLKKKVKKAADQAELPTL